MSATATRVFSGLRRAVFTRGISIHNATSTVRLNSVRSLAKSTEDNEEENDKPIKFSTSKGSHRTWKVEQSMGSDYAQPMWKVATINTLIIVFLLWCVFREETEIDELLEKHLYERLPGLLPEEDTENKSD